MWHSIHPDHMLLVFKSTVWWMVLAALSLTPKSALLSDVPCAVTEECSVGTVICDLETILDKMGLALPKRTDLTDSHDRVANGPAHRAALDKSVQITIINEARAFVVVNRRLVSRDRIDREQYVHTKQCRRSHREHDDLDPTDLDDEPNRIDCVIDLELAILRSGAGHEQPTFVQLPVRILDVNDHAPQFDQHTSGLWLEADEDIQDQGQGHAAQATASSAFASLTGDGDSARTPEDGRRSRRREIAVLPLAKDMDYGPNGSVTYSLGGPDADLFELEEDFQIPPTDSSLSVIPQLVGASADRAKQISRLRLLARRALDHETKSQHRLTLIARDQCPMKEMQRQTELPITLAVREVNEYAPVFDLGQGSNGAGVSARIHPAVVHVDILSGGPSTDRQSNTVILEVPEDIPVGSRIYQVLATDGDSSGQDPGSRKMMAGSSAPISAISGAGIHYALANNADLKTRRFVRIGAADGWMTLLHPLDHELGPRQLELPIVATDGGRPARTGTLTVHIRVLDVNDEAPSIEVRGLSTGSTDTGFQAGMGGSDPMMTGPVLHRVQVLTVRENAPPGTFVAKISTSDPDKGAAGEISCYLGDPLVDLTHQRLATTSFTADALSHSRTDFLLQSGSASGVPSETVNLMLGDSERQGRRDADYMLVTRVRLDRETKAWYILSIVCHDHGDQLSDTVSQHERRYNTQTRRAQSARRLSTTRLVKVVVLDENDNGPKFARQHVNAQVPEHSKPGANIVQLKAVDNDAPGLASRTHYRLAQPTEWNDNSNSQNKTVMDSSDVLSEYFSVDNLTGWLRTGARQLDRELREKYSIAVVAYDFEFPNRTALAWVHVQVTDINDNAPALVGNTTFSIEEEESSLAVHNALVATAVATTNQPDSTDPKLSRPGGRPIFVGHLQAEDLDSDENGQVTFSLAPIDTHQSSQQLSWFLRPDGTLFVHSNSANPLDRETQAVHYIPVVIRDHGSPVPLSSTYTVTVSVLDKNDNAPWFERPAATPDQRAGSSTTEDGHMYLPRLPIDHIKVSEATSPGTLIYTALARDPDEAENGQVLYSLEPYQGFWQLVQIRPQPAAKNRSVPSETNRPQQSRYFIIDSNSGEIRVNQRLSRTDSTVPRKLVIFAQDQGVPSRRSYAFLYVDIVPIPGVGARSNRTDLPGTAASAGFASASHSSAFHTRRAEPATDPESGPGRPASRSRDPDRQSVAAEASVAGELGALAHQSKHTETSGSTRASGLRPYLTWNSELITGLGIGLVVLILICLLLLITYAVHGTKLVQRRQAARVRGTRTRSGSGKSDAAAGAAAAAGNHRIWLTGRTEPVTFGAVSNEDKDEFKGKGTHLRETVRNVWNQRSNKSDVNELKPGPRQGSPMTLTESDFIKDGSRAACIYLAHPSAPTATVPFYPDPCSHSSIQGANDTRQMSTLPRPGGRYEPLTSLVEFASPVTNERWYVHAPLEGGRSPSANSYLCTSSQSTTVPVTFGAARAGPVDCSEAGRRSAPESKYTTLSDEDRSRRVPDPGTYYTIHPESRCCNQSPLAIKPVDSSACSFAPQKLTRVTFSHESDGEDQGSAPMSDLIRLPGCGGGGGGAKQMHMSITPESSSNTEEENPFQCADEVCPFAVGGGQSLTQPKSVPQSACPKPKPVGDSSFV